jgi:hypothetical protein
MKICDILNIIKLCNSSRDLRNSADGTGQSGYLFMCKQDNLVTYSCAINIPVKENVTNICVIQNDQKVYIQEKTKYLLTFTFIYKNYWK